MLIIRADTAEEFRKALIENIRAQANKYRGQDVLRNDMPVRQAARITAAVCDAQAEMLGAIMIERK
jgi:hypothetical protein